MKQFPIISRLMQSSLKTTLIFYPLLISAFALLNYWYAQNSLLAGAALFGGGILVWTLLEYVFNRFMPMLSRTFPALRTVHYLLHGIHYHNPKKQEHLFMAPLPGFVMAVLTFVFWYLIMKNDSFCFSAGIITGYLFYATVHYLVHRNPGKLIFHKLWLHHLKHHHRYPDKAFGVTSPLWDFIFGTMPPRHDNARRQFS